MAKVKIRGRAATGGEALPWAFASASGVGGMVKDEAAARLVDAADVDRYIRDLQVALPGWTFESVPVAVPASAPIVRPAS